MGPEAWVAALAVAARVAALEVVLALAVAAWAAAHFLQLEHHSSNQ